MLGAGYTPFGEQLGVAKQNGYGYNAEDYDAATGMLNLRARQYEPAMNRFSVKDIYPSNPLVGASFNSYVYTYNNPVGFVDANGLSASSLRKVLTTTGHTLQSAATAAGATAAVASVLIGTSVVNAVTGRVQSASKIAATQASKNRTTQKVSATQKASGMAAQAKQQLAASNKVHRESVTQTTGGIIASCSGYKAAQQKPANVSMSEILNATIKVEKGVVLSTDKNAAGRLVMPAGTYSPQEIISYVIRNGDEQARRELMNAISAGNSVESALQSYVAMHEELTTLSAWKPGIVDEIQMEIKKHQGHPEYAINQAYQLLLEPHVERYVRITESENLWEALRNIENFLLMGMVDDSYELLYGEGNSAVKVGVGANLLMKAFSFGGGWGAIKNSVAVYPTTEDLISYGNHVAPWYGGGQYGDTVPAGAFDAAFSIDGLWDMPEGGKAIGGRWYSQHALERMAPNVFEARAKLYSRATKLAQDLGLTPGTPEYSKFVDKYVDPRGIPPSVVESAITNGTSSLGNLPGTYVYETEDIKVVVNAVGSVITVIPK